MQMSERSELHISGRVKKIERLFDFFQSNYTLRQALSEGVFKL